MKVVVGSWFQLPRLGTDVFASMMKAGVKYEKGMGFMFTSETDVRAASGTVARALGEPVDVSLRCFSCGREACPGCPFLSMCDRRVVSPACLCAEHSEGPDAFSNYGRTVESLLAGG